MMLQTINLFELNVFYNFETDLIIEMLFREKVFIWAFYIFTFEKILSSN